MRPSTTPAKATYLSLLVLPISSALQIPSIFAPFYSPFESSILANISSLSSPPQNEHELLKRDGNCPSNFNSCSTFRDSAGGACCTAGSFCTTDRAKNIACCPTGAVCTGSLDIASATTTVLGGGGAVFGTSTGTGTGTSTTTTITTAPTATITDSATVSYVANAFFPFPYIPTTYANSAACNSAYQDCQTNYAACTSALDGSGSGNAGFGVTIVAPNGGITASPTIQSLGVASATSICSSLSAQGCYNIVSDNCAQFGTGTEVNFVAGTTATGNAGVRARATGCLGVGVGVGVLAGVGLGVAGQMI